MIATIADRCVQLLADDKGTLQQAADEHVGTIFNKTCGKRLLNRIFKKRATICVKH